MRRERKRRARAAGEATASANRAAFGIAPSFKTAATAERERAEQRLEGHRLAAERDAPEQA